MIGRCRLDCRLDLRAEVAARAPEGGGSRSVDLLDGPPLEPEPVPPIIIPDVGAGEANLGTVNSEEMQESAFALATAAVMSSVSSSHPLSPESSHTTCCRSTVGRFLCFLRLRLLSARFSFLFLPGRCNMHRR